MMNALKAGAAILRGGGSALDAVVAGVVILEDDPLFNAGFGSTLNADGAVEMDASVMVSSQGETKAGAVATISRVKNPVLLAREVMEHTTHVMLAGNGAERFARDRGFRLCDPDSMIAPRARERWIALVLNDSMRWASLAMGMARWARQRSILPDHWRRRLRPAACRARWPDASATARSSARAPLRTKSQQRRRPAMARRSSWRHYAARQSRRLRKSHPTQHRAE